MELAAFEEYGARIASLRIASHEADRVDYQFGGMARFAAKQSAPDSDPSRERLLGSPPPELLGHRVELLADQGNGTRVLSRRSVVCTRQPDAPTAKS